MAIVDVFHENDRSTPWLTPSLAAQGIRQRVQRGDWLYQAGEDGGAVSVVLCGLVRRTLLTPEGRQVIVDLAAPGDLLGEAALYGRVHHTSAQAVIAGEMLRLPAHTFRQHLLTHPTHALTILQSLALRINRAQTLTELLMSRSAPARLATVLLSLPPAALHQLAHQDFGEMIGVYRETATTILNDFQRQGLIRIAPRRITLLQPARLRQLADSTRRRDVQLALRQNAPPP